MQYPYTPENHPTQTLLTTIATKLTLKHGLLVAIALLAGAAFAELPGLSGSTPAAAQPSLSCQAPPTMPVQSLTPAQLQRLKTTPQGTAKQTLQATLPKVYCQLPAVSLRAGTIAQRDVFQINASTWLIVMYEGDRFAGVREVK